MWFSYKCHVGGLASSQVGYLQTVLHGVLHMYVLLDVRILHDTIGHGYWLLVAQTSSFSLTLLQN